MNTKLVTKIYRSKCKTYYKGAVACVVDNKTLWTEYYDAWSLNKEDAKLDALWLRDDIASYNMLVKAN